MDDNKVAILLEDLRSQFRTFGEGLELLNEKVDRIDKKVDKLELKLDAHIVENQTEFAKINKKFDDNHQEHQQIMQMVKELDSEVQVEIKRVK